MQIKDNEFIFYGYFMHYTFVVLRCSRSPAI